tara:strand:- start:1997 stop:4630 length:2634 start_codon:yes stop_codon:yes gene_type:complete
MQIVEMERNEQDLASTKKAYARFSERVSQLVDGDYLLKQGEAAVGGSSGDDVTEGVKLSKTLDEELRKFADELPTEVSKGMFSEAGNKLLTSARMRINTHQSKQRKVWLAGETSAMMKSAAQASIDAYMAGEEDDLMADLMGATPGKSAWKMQLDTAVDQARELARLNGLGPEATNQAIEGVKTGVYSGIVTELLDEERTSDAKEFLKDHAKDMEQGSVRDLRKLVRTASVSDDALRLAMSLKDTHDVDGDKRLDSTELNAIGDELNKRFLAGGIDAKMRSNVLGFLKEALGRHKVEAADEAAKIKGATKSAGEAGDFVAVFGVGPEQKTTRGNLEKTERNLHDKLDSGVKTGRITEDEADFAKTMFGAVRWAIGKSVSMSDEIADGMKAGKRPAHRHTSEWLGQARSRVIREGMKYSKDPAEQKAFIDAGLAAAEKAYDRAVKEEDLRISEIRDEMEQYAELSRGRITSPDAAPREMQLRWIAAGIMDDARDIFKATNEQYSNPEKETLFYRAVEEGTLRYMPNAQFRSMLAGLGKDLQATAKEMRTLAVANTPLQGGPEAQLLRVAQKHQWLTGEGSKGEIIPGQKNIVNSFLWEKSWYRSFLAEWNERKNAFQEKLPKGVKISDQESLDIGMKMLIDFGGHTAMDHSKVYPRAGAVTTRDYRGWNDDQEMHDWHLKRLTDEERAKLLGHEAEEEGSRGRVVKMSTGDYVAVGPQLRLPEGTHPEDAAKWNYQSRADAVQLLYAAQNKTYSQRFTDSPIPRGVSLADVPRIEEKDLRRILHLTDKREDLPDWVRKSYPDRKGKEIMPTQSEQKELLDLFIKYKVDHLELSVEELWQRQEVLEESRKAGRDEEEVQRRVKRRGYSPGGMGIGRGGS